MHSLSKIKNTLKNLPFYSEEIKSFKKSNKKFSNISLLSKLPFFPKKIKNFTNYQLSKELQFFPRRPERPRKPTKHQILKNILPLYDSVGISRRERAFRGYIETYNVEVADRISLSDSLFLAKSSIVDLFKDLLKEKRSFKYVLSTTITLKRWNNAINRYDIETIYIISEAITVINQRFNLNISCEKLKRVLDIWTGQGSGWLVNKIEDIHIKISNYEPLAGSSYMPLPSKSNNSMKGLIYFKNEDDECFKWCHVRFINPQNKNSERIKKEDKKIASTLDYRGINFPMKAGDYEIVEERFNINVNVFGYENKVFPLYVSKKSNEQVLNVLLISNEEKSHYVFIKDFNRLMYSKAEHKEKNTFVCHVYKILQLRKY